MKRVYSTANGKRINLDAIIAQNENTIAVGNMKVNARGDQLGPGGKVEATRDKVMAEHYKLSSPIATDSPPVSHKKVVKKESTDDWIEPVVETHTPPEISETQESTPVLRGRLADSVAKNLPQEPAVKPKKTGPTRI